MKTPILDEILKLKNKKGLSFHTPGHKNGQVLPKIMHEVWPEDIWSFDLTEIDQLDNLHCPEACIRESERLIAEFLGAGQSFFLINGSTVGIEAAIIALCSEMKIFIPRHAHQAAYNGAILANAKVISLPVVFDSQLNLPLGLEPEVLEKFIKKHSDCKTLFLPSPNYEGICYKVEANINLAKKHGLKIILDEAHGSHFLLDERFPQTGLALGADLVIQSWHKTLPSLTQAAMLHLHPDYQGPGLRRYLNLLQSTSPSYLLLASLEASRVFLEETRGKAKEIVDHLLNFRASLAKLQNIKLSIISEEPADLCKLCLLPLHITGYQLEAILREQYGIYAEMCTKKHVLLILPLIADHQSFAQLKKALQEIDRERVNCLADLTCLSQISEESNYQSEMDIREAFFSPKERLPLQNAKGRISGQFLVQYPPGIPTLLPGEEITAAIIKQTDLFTIEVVQQNQEMG